MGVGGWFDNLFCLRRFVRRREEGVWQYGQHCQDPDDCYTKLSGLGIAKHYHSQESYVRVGTENKVREVSQ